MQSADLNPAKLNVPLARAVHARDSDLRVVACAQINYTDTHTHTRALIPRSSDGNSEARRELSLSPSRFYSLELFANRRGKGYYIYVRVYNVADGGEAGSLNLAGFFVAQKRGARDVATLVFLSGVR